MGLFSRRKAEVIDDSWQPAGGDPEELAGDDADMDDDGQATDLGYRAYRVYYGMPGDPRPVIAVWTYAVFVGDEEYAVGLRYLYVRGDHPEWSYTGYHDDPLEEVYTAPGEADVEATKWAESLAAGNPDSMGNLSAVFEWDGEPFPVGDAG